MALIDYLPPEEADGVAREVLERFREEHGQSPLIYEALAHNEDVVAARHAYFSAIMGRGNVDRERKDFAYVVVSEANDCDYCVGAHSRVYTEELGGDPAALDAVATGDFDELDPPERAIAEFARQAAVDPKRVGESHLEALADAGFSTSDVVELLAVVASAKAANTIVDALDVHPTDRS